MNIPIRRRAQIIWSVTLNALVPGAGLIVLRREWLGTWLALLFVLPAQGALWGWLLVPEEIPPAVAGVLAIAAGGVWVLAQVLLGLRIRLVTSARVEHTLRLLLKEAEAALLEGRLREADELIGVALGIDDESPAVRALQARLLAEQSEVTESRRWWSYVLRAAPDGPLRVQAEEALRRAETKYE